MIHSKYTTPEQIEQMRREIQQEKKKMSDRQIKNQSVQSLPSRMRAVLRMGGWAVFLSIVTMLVSSIILINMAKSRGEIPSVGGFHLFSIESGSMEPTLRVGSLILSRKPNDPSSLREKQIVTFKTSSNFIVTHRIIQVVKTAEGKTAYRTKGDNPINSPDQELLIPDRVIGVFLARVPFT